MSTEATSTTTETGHGPRHGASRTAALGQLVLPAALLLIGILGHLVVPGGPARAVLLLPCLFWIPGRALAAAIGLGPKTSGQFLTFLSVLLSCVALILAGLLTNVILGHVPLATLPLWLSGVLLPLFVLGSDPLTGTRAALPSLRVAALFTVAFVASAALLWGAVYALPQTKQTSYLTFYLSGSYTKVQGVIPATAGQTLQVPLAVGGGGSEDLSGLSVATYIDGAQAGSAVPVTVAGKNDGSMQVPVTAPAASGCPHQIRLILEQGTTQLRSVDLYVQVGKKGAGCGNG